MPAIAVVYSTASKMLRRVIADDDGQITTGKMPDGVTRAVICHHRNGSPSFHPLMPGESVLIEQVNAQAVATDHHAWRASIARVTGTDPPTIVCALINNGVVVQLIHADPDVDASPSPDLLMVHCYSPAITVGCSYDAGTGLFTMPEGSIPPGAPGNKTDQPIIIPPTVIPKPEP